MGNLEESLFVVCIMDFSSFNLQENGDLFKQNYQLNDNNHGGNNNEQQSVDGSTVFFNFMDSDSTSYNAPSNNSNNNSNNVHTHQNTFTVPQLSPDGNEGSFTNSSVLSGHNPEFNMSPLQIASQPRNNNNITNTSSMLQTYHTPIQHASQSNLLEDFADEEVNHRIKQTSAIVSAHFFFFLYYRNSLHL